MVRREPTQVGFFIRTYDATCGTPSEHAGEAHTRALHAPVALGRGVSNKHSKKRSDGGRTSEERLNRLRMSPVSVLVYEPTGSCQGGAEVSTVYNYTTRRYILRLVHGLRQAGPNPNAQRPPRWRCSATTSPYTLTGLCTAPAQLITMSMPPKVAPRVHVACKLQASLDRPESTPTRHARRRSGG